MELAVIVLFCAALFICISLDISVIIPLMVGFVLFFCYGLLRGHGVGQMVRMVLDGVKTVHNILIIFVLIGVITAVWRVSGTIAYIVYYATGVLRPEWMVLCTFLLCCLISVLTGTAFGTAATMGAICVTVANGMGIPLLLSGGAVMAGSYFGDRCSPMSSSALLVCTLTGTDPFRNLLNMAKKAVVPFLLSCAIYWMLGMGAAERTGGTEVRQIFQQHFVLHPATLIPAVVIVLLSLFRVNVKITMVISVIFGGLVAVFVQGVDLPVLLRVAVAGYHPEEPAIGALLSGGGIVSMARVVCIVCLSSSYSGMFNGTGLLDGIRGVLFRLARCSSPYISVLLTAIITAMIACNQTLTIMLTHQLCEGTEEDGEKMASYLEDTTVVIAPLIPWSIAAGVTLTSVNAPLTAILAAVYLYLQPICSMVGKPRSWFSFNGNKILDEGNKCK